MIATSLLREVQNSAYSLPADFVLPAFNLLFLDGEL
jgi:hypothetical protein